MQIKTIKNIAPVPPLARRQTATQ
ncbi:hypothetical protein A2U01_0116015, partial [Trifolium medium]|nr:hypothetical protein [Trifolium medium]